MEIIAEIGQNHNGDMTLARELIRAAKENGADTAKFQVYEARALFPKEGNPWYDYNCQTELSRDQVLALARNAPRPGSSSWPRSSTWSGWPGWRRPGCGATRSPPGPSGKRS